MLPAGFASNPIKVIESLLPALGPALARATTSGSSLHRPSLHQCQAARQGFSQPGWPVPPPAQLKPAPDPSPVQEVSSLENLTKFSTSVKHPDTSLIASALLHLGGQDSFCLAPSGRAGQAPGWKDGPPNGNIEGKGGEWIEFWIPLTI